MSTRVKYHKYHTFEMVALSAGIAVNRRGRSADNKMGVLPGTSTYPLIRVRVSQFFGAVGDFRLAQDLYRRYDRK